MNDNSIRGMTVMDWAENRPRITGPTHIPDAAALCTPEERAFLDQLKAGKSLISAQHAANVVWATRNRPAIDVLRNIADQRAALWEEWSAAWGQLELPFKDCSCRGAGHGIYGYCSGDGDYTQIATPPTEPRI